MHVLLIRQNWQNLLHTRDLRFSLSVMKISIGCDVMPNFWCGTNFSEGYTASIFTAALYPLTSAMASSHWRPPSKPNLDMAVFRAAAPCKLVGVYRRVTAAGRDFSFSRRHVRIWMLRHVVQCKFIDVSEVLSAYIIARLIFMYLRLEVPCSWRHRSWFSCLIPRGTAGNCEHFGETTVTTCNTALFSCRWEK
jgi:hypothetical protein